MRTKQEKEIIQALQNNDICNYIDLNYWKLDTQTKNDILKETLYLLPKELYKQLIDNLIEYRDFLEEEENENNEEN